MSASMDRATVGAQGRRLRHPTLRRSGARRVLRAGAAAVVSVLLALTSAPAVSAAASPFAPAPEVSVGQGRLRGVEHDGVAEFLGIRYAAPPVGRLRWRPPQPAAAWSGTRSATRPGRQCPQALDEGTVTTDEDCLFVNVYAPAGRPAGRRPVMVAPRRLIRLRLRP